MHYARKCKKKEKTQNFVGTVAQSMHRDEVMKERQRLEEKVMCNNVPLKNCYTFKYLGSMFTADGHSDVDIKRRIGMAVSRCGQLRFILNAKNIKMKTKLKIYVCGSIAIYIRQ